MEPASGTRSRGRPRKDGVMNRPTVIESSFERTRFHFECAELPDQFVVMGFEAIEALNEPYRWTVSLRTEESTDCARLLGRDVSLAIAGADDERYFRGIVDKIGTGHD